MENKYYTAVYLYDHFQCIRYVKCLATINQHKKTCSEELTKILHESRFAIYIQIRLKRKIHGDSIEQNEFSDLIFVFIHI